MVAFHSGRSLYALFQIVAKHAEMVYKNWCIAVYFGWPHTTPKTALTLLNIYVPDKFEAADRAFLHESIASTFPQEKMQKDTASCDPWSPSWNTGHISDRARDRDSGKSR